MITFEVRTLTNKGLWTTSGRWPSESDALNEAYTLVSQRKHRAVKVVRESFDPATSLYRERVVFRHSLERRFAPASTAKAGSGATASSPRRFHAGRIRRAWSPENRTMLIAALLALGLAVNVVLGFLLGTADFDTGTPRTTADGRSGIVYELPAMTVDVQDGNGLATVRMTLGLQLARREHIAGIERALAPIMAAAFADLKRTPAAHFARSEMLQQLRARLHRDIRAAGGGEVEGVLFRHISVD